MTADTSSLPAHFDPEAIEPGLVARWVETGVGRADVTSAKPKFSIIMPPPNVTGQLHIGHALDQTLQDVVVRHKRQRGFDVLWLPGTDHASIATHFVVERELAKTGETRFTLGRDEFLRRAEAWRDLSAGTIQSQLRRLGCTPDWSRERFTLDPVVTKAVMRVFVSMYREGLIHRGTRLVNWDPKFRTAVSDLEVETREVEGHLWHLRYPLADDPSRHIVVATTRPETLFGDQAVAVNAEDERYRDLVGRHVTLPLTGRTIPIIADEHADPEQGSGAVKITPAHDFNDHAVGLRHGLVPLDVMTPDGRMNDAVPDPFRGLDRFEARARAVEALEALGLVEKIEPKTIAQPFGDRSQVVLEPRITDQWFMKTDGLAAAAAEAVRSGETRFVPGNWANVFHRWMDNIEPWCISRQLWYGHRIPAWYGEDGDVFVAETAEEAEAEARARYGRDVALTRDPDILDTWFSSALWPFATLGWPDATPDLARYYPQDLLVTGFDIIFFWVARMMMQSIHFETVAPFRDIYIHGLVRDAQGQKMSKTKGNVIDPLDLIAQYGTDATRMTMMTLCGHGQDIRMSAEAVRPARLFANKLWNAARFAAFNRCFEAPTPLPAAPSNPVDAWIVTQLAAVARRTLDLLDDYRFAEAATGLQAFVRDTFCDWYVELAKIGLNGPDAAAADETRAVVGWCLKAILQLLNPFMPFVTEALWDNTRPGEAITAARLPDFAALPAAAAAAATAQVEGVIALVSRIRSVRSELKVAPGKPVPLLVAAPSDAARALLDGFGPYIRRLANLSEIATLGDVPEGAVRLAVDGTDYLLPLGGIVDFDKERARLGRERDKAAKDAAAIAARLADEAFIAKAKPEVIDTNRARLSALEAEHARIEAALALL